MVELLLLKLLDLSCLEMQFYVPIHLAEALTKCERKSETTVEEVQPDMMSNIVRVAKSKTLPWYIVITSQN